MTGLAPELDDKAVLAIAESYRNDPQQLIACLLDIQEASRRSYVEPRWAAVAAKAMGVPVGRVYEILTFYSMFSTEPRGRWVIEVCGSSPCLFNGSGELRGWIAGALGVTGGETTPDGLFTLAACGCVGFCAGAPAVKIGDAAYTVSGPAEAERLIRSFREDDPASREVFLCRE
ncbi:MAG: NAD(P)H-dependent oxidoreductase subunit E [Deltaproteobacteria bacterium]|jgi:NADH-quinone oxidoreductase subunit E|nr:NAD(P)H-dependent oxidoreductase subunit E [Deltaproteobacteria bacterium]